MQVSTKQVEPQVMEATITLDKDELNSFLQKTRELLAGELTVEGFRKGKAPQHIVDQNLKPETIRAEALEAALEDSFARAVTQEHWDVMGTRDLKVQRNDADGLAYSVVISLWPVVKLADLATVRIPRKPLEVSDAEVDEALDTVRNMRATFLEKTGAIALGDRAEVDFDASINGTPVEGGSSRNHPLIVGGASFMPGFEDQLVGLAAGATKEFTLKAPDDYYESKLAGKEVQFKVTVHRVQSVLKPAADDAFAASVGTFTSLTELKDSLRKGITEEKGTKEQQRLRLAILDAIIKDSEVPTPKAMVAAELDDMVHRFGHDLASRGAELAMYLARMNKTEDQLRSEWTSEAERQVRIMLILRAVAQQRGISVDPAELDAAFNETVGELIRSGQVAEDQVDPSRIRSVIAERMLRDKVLAAIEESCAA